MLKTPPKRSKKQITAQAMVEFALALPILLLVVYGLLETGRLLFIYASVVTAARQAARYGSASGDIGSGTLYYNDCAGIEAAANRVAFIQRFKQPIIIKYDKGPNDPTPFNSLPGCPISPLITDNEHRIRVTVETTFVPIVRLVPLQPLVITSTSNRTILTGVPIAVDTPATGFGGGGSNLVAISKTTNLPNDEYDHLGQVVTYTYVVSNPGSNPLTIISLSDDRTSVNCPASVFSTPLPGGASAASCTATYTITQADLDAGKVTNKATVVASDGSAPLTTWVTKTITFAAKPGLKLTKTGVAPDTVKAGQKIVYTFTLENTGNVSLNSPYSIVDSKVTGDCSSAKSPLAPGASTTCTGTYDLKNSDINTGYVDNTAQAVARQGGTPITSNSASARVYTPELLLVLTADKYTVSSVPTTLTFTYTLTNRTTSSMSNITVSDDHGASNLACVASLAAGASGSCTNTYTVTQADMDASSVLVDTATANAQGKVTSNPAGVTIQLNQSPVLTLKKVASPSRPSSGVTFILPQNITYSYTLQNTGNVTLSAPFVVTDDKLGTVCTISNGTLAPGAPPLTCSKTYALTQADLDAGTVINKATATATFSAQTVTSAQATAIVITYTDARMALIKTAGEAFFTGPGQPIHYKYTLKNTGGQALVVNAPYTLTDNLLGNFTCGGNPINLPLGGSAGCNNKTYTTSLTDYTKKAVINTVSPAAGSTTTPPLTNTPFATLTVPLFECNTNTVTGSGAIPDGSDVTWTITNSTGLPIHIASVTITWNNASLLTQVFLNSISIWAGSGNSGIVLPGGPWTLNVGANPLRLLFSPGASSIRVAVGFTESACNFFLYSSP